MDVSNSISSANTLVFDDVVGVILSKEMRRKSKGEMSSSALSTENRVRQREGGNNQVNHDRSRRKK